MVEDFYHQPDTCNLNMMAMLVDGSNVVNKNHTNYHHDVNRTRHGKVTNNLETYFDNPQANDCVKLATTVPEGADAEEFTTLMRDRYANYFDIYSSGFRTIEFMTPGIDKGYGLRMVMAHYYLNDDEVAVIGDAANDISMMIYSGHAFGMASGEPHIRKYCRYTAKSVAQAVDEVLAYNQQQQAK
jgi:HAD superfamily hydrolase (TIGR01484 family)